MDWNENTRGAKKVVKIDERIKTIAISDPKSESPDPRTFTYDYAFDENSN
jgi:hypothetical protein